MEPNRHDPSTEGTEQESSSSEMQAHEPGFENPGETGAASGSSDAQETPSVAQLQTELEAANDRWVRSQAELDNYIKRSRREQTEALRYATAPLLTELLGVVDNLQRAIDAAKEGEQNQGLLQGVEMVAVQLRQTLEQHGCKPIPTAGQPFDPNRHEAVIMEPTDEYPPNTVIRELRSGYELHDRVLRPPQVVVAAAGSGTAE